MDFRAVGALPFTGVRCVERTFCSDSSRTERDGRTGGKLPGAGYHTEHTYQ